MGPAVFLFVVVVVVVVVVVICLFFIILDRWLLYPGHFGQEKRRLDICLFM